MGGAAQHILLDPGRFSEHVLRMALHPYQLEPVRAIAESVIQHRGEEFLLVFPRQSGKNEAAAHLLVYLLNLLQRAGGNIVYGAIGDGLGRGLDRLEERLDNQWNAGQWRKDSKPTRRRLGKASVVFLSSHPQAHARGETANHLLIIDELQDQDADHIEAVFTPMRASYNACALYLGTVRSRHDALWRKREQLLRRQKRSGRTFVYLVPPSKVVASNAAYGEFLAGQIKRHGRHHPTIKAEYFLEPVDAQGGLFPPRRQALMRGTHRRRRTPETARSYIATIDVGGQDEASTDPHAELKNPGRDYTVATISEVVHSADNDEAGEPAGPTYLVRDQFADHGSRHFEDVPGQPSLAKRLATYLDLWEVEAVVIDAGGVGEGLTSYLTSQIANLEPFVFTRRSKAQLGSRFLTLIETGRFKWWAGDEEPLSAGWWYWQQVTNCSYEIDPRTTIDTGMTWGVPDGATISTPAGRQAIHDDRLISAALVAHVDALLQAGDLALGAAVSAIIPPFDPLSDMSF